MLKKVSNIFKTRGIIGIVSEVISRSYPKKISNYETYFRNLTGKSGLEIGGPSGVFKESGILPLYPIVANLDGCNFSGTTVWEGKIKEGMTYRYHKNKKKGYQFICDGVDLRVIPSKTYDFVLSSHTIEHIANPFKAISEWLRVLKDDGILLLVVPHKDGTFDHNRTVTSLGHLIDDFEKNVKEDDLTHLPEILELHDLNLDPPAGDFESFKKRSINNYENRCLHHHVFNTELAVEVFNYFNLQIMSVNVALPHHIIIMGKKLLSDEIVNNDAFLGEDAEYRPNSPFESDKR